MKTIVSWLMLFVMIFVLSLMLAVPAMAQDTAASSPSGIPGLSVKQSLYVTWHMIGAKYLAELYSSVRAGGGLKRIVMAFCYGEQLPRVVAEDYKKELSHPPFEKP